MTGFSNQENVKSLILFNLFQVPCVFLLVLLENMSNINQLVFIEYLLHAYYCSSIITYSVHRSLKNQVKDQHKLESSGIVLLMQFEQIYRMVKQKEKGDIMKRDTSTYLHFFYLYFMVMPFHLWLIHYLTGICKLLPMDFQTFPVHFFFFLRFLLFCFQKKKKCGLPS